MTGVFFKAKWKEAGYLMNLMRSNSWQWPLSRNQATEDCFLKNLAENGLEARFWTCKGGEVGNFKENNIEGTMVEWHHRKVQWDSIFFSRVVNFGNSKTDVAYINIHANHKHTSNHKYLKSFYPKNTPFSRWNKVYCTDRKDWLI